MNRYSGQQQSTIDYASADAMEPIRNMLRIIILSPNHNLQLAYMI